MLRRQPKKKVATADMATNAAELAHFPQQDTNLVSAASSGAISKATVIAATPSKSPSTNDAGPVKSGDISKRFTSMTEVGNMEEGVLPKESPADEVAKIKNSTTDIKNSK